MSAAAPLFEFVRDGAEQLAIVIRSGTSKDKYNFSTAPESTLQLGVTFYGKGDEVAPHGHHQRHVASRDCQEFLMVQDGAIEIMVYREDGTRIARFELGPGEAVLFQQGCHALRCLAPTRLLEVKQGPYVSPELDKYLLDVVDPYGDGGP